MQQYTFINLNTCKYTILLMHNLCTVCTILVFGITCVCLFICNKFFFFFCSNQNTGLDNVRINTGSSMHVYLCVWGVGVGDAYLCVHACMCVCTGVCVCTQHFVFLNFFFSFFVCIVMEVHWLHLNLVCRKYPWGRWESFPPVLGFFLLLFFLFFSFFFGDGAISIRPNIGIVSKETLGKVVWQDGVSSEYELSLMMLSWSELNWTVLFISVELQCLLYFKTQVHLMFMLVAITISLRRGSCHW